MALSRREFVSLSALGTSGALLGGWGRPASAEKAPVRAEATTKEGRDALVEFEKAVSRMKSWCDDESPLHWKNQAKFHMDYCPHENWWFLPWHRAYLYYFELACQKVLKSPSFRLPYWDWTKSPKIPDSFFDEKSALYHKDRVLKKGESLPSDAQVGPSMVQSILKTPFLDSIYGYPTKDDDQMEMAGQGAIEGRPHAGVHSHVGGSMRVIPNAPLDPIFWLHHANVDRIWERYLVSSDGFKPPSPTWIDHKLEAFFNPLTSEAVRPTVAEVLKAFQPTYDSCEVVPGLKKLLEPFRRSGSLPTFTKEQTDWIAFEEAPLPRRMSRFSEDGGLNLYSSALSRDLSAGLDRAVIKAHIPVSVREPGPMNASFDCPDSECARESRSPEVEYHALHIKGVRESGTCASYRVYINARDPAKADEKDAGYVGTIYRFGGHAAHAGGPHSVHQHVSNTMYVLDCTETLQRLKNEGRFRNAEDGFDVALVDVSSYNAGADKARNVFRPAYARLEKVAP